MENYESFPVRLLTPRLVWFRPELPVRCWPIGGDKSTTEAATAKLREASLRGADETELIFLARGAEKRRSKHVKTSSSCKRNIRCSVNITQQPKSEETMISRKCARYRPA